MSAAKKLPALTDAQQRLLAHMIPGQWYGDRVAEDVKHWPKAWDARTFRQILRKLEEQGVIEKRMRKYEYGEAFNVRLPEYTKPKQDNAEKIARALSMVAESRPRMAKLTREQRKELEAEARKAMGKPKQAKAVKAQLSFAPAKLGGPIGAGMHFIAGWETHDCTVPVFVLPADKASVERMREQAMRAIINDPMATLGDTITAVFASIGITSTKGRK